jgi:hypothetical protein
MQSKTAENPKRKTPKVAKCSIATDEAVVAGISKRALVKIKASEGLHIISSEL